MTDQNHALTATAMSFSFEGSDIRIVMRGDDPWWMLADVCRALDIVNVGNALGRLEEDEKHSIRLADGTPGNPNVAIISEPGLYRLIMRSDKAEAKRFQRWVFQEVLPSIRKTGSYSMAAKSPAEILVMMATQVLDHERRIIAAEAVAAEAKEIAQIAEAKAQATAMACQDYSIMAWSRLQAIPIDIGTAQALGQKAAAMSRKQGLPIGTARDPRFGKVNTYIETVLEEVFADHMKDMRF